jgi:multidrug efflux pump subunit AcrA (membrane-fusion protein)
VAVLAGDVVFLATRGSGSRPRPLIVTAEVTRRTLDDTVTLSGTLSRLAQRTVTATTTGQVSGVSVANGQIVQAGQSLIGIDGRESVAEDGSFPFFRSLSLGDTGQDVMQLDQILAGQGYDPGPLSTTFTTQTQFALGQWQAAHSYPGLGPIRPESVNVSLEPSSAYKVGDQSSIGFQISGTEGASSSAGALQSIAHTSGPTARLESRFVADGPSLPVLTIEPLNLVTVKGSPAVFVVYSSTASNEPIDFSAVEGGNAPASEVLPPLGPFTLPAGSTSVEVEVPTRQDGRVEPSVTLSLQLEAGTGYAVGDPSVGDTTIESTDVPQVTVTGGGSVQPGQVGTVTVSVNQAPVQPTQILLSTGGDAQAGTDYVPLEPVVTLPPGQTSATVKLQTLTPEGIRPNRYVVISAAQSTSYSLGSVDAAVVTILGQTGAAALPQVTLQAESNYIVKGQPLPLVIGLSEALTTPLNISLTYGGTAREGYDYLPVAGQITIPPGQTSLPVQVPTVSDNSTEANTTLTVTLGSSGAYLVGSPSEVSTVITSSALPTLTISTNASSVGQGASTSFTITADQPPVQNTSVDFQVSGTAQPGEAYQPLTGTALLKAGQTSVTVPLLTLDQNVDFQPTDMIAGHWPIRVGQVFVKSGDEIPQPGFNLFTLTDTNFTVTLTATPTDRTQLKVGQSCTVELQDGSAETTGVISQLDDNVTVDSTTGAETYSGKIAVGNIGAADGATVTIDVTDQAADNVLTVPIAAVKQNGLGQDVVRVLDLANRGRVTEVPVQTGLADDSYIEIDKGLSAGQIVIVEEDESSG